MKDDDARDHRGTLSPPPRLYERLAQLPGYTWDQSFQPFHSTYDNWHVFGVKHISRGGSTASSAHGVPRTNSGASSPKLGSRPSFRHQRTGSADLTEHEMSKPEGEDILVSVIARVSTHVLRIEREHHLCKSFAQTADPDYHHTVRVLDLVRLSGHHKDEDMLIVSIFEMPGRNYLKALLDFGPAWLGPERHLDEPPMIESIVPTSQHKVSLTTFLDFAIAACECLELLHHGLRVVHGELRSDAFHFNQDTRVVKLVNFGSGPRSFENGLTSSGWIALSREVGVKHKLQFIAPEQTGRMPAEPNSRTDIYGLGIMFWTMLTERPAFQGETPMDVVQAVLGRRLPLVSSVRMDTPDAIAKIIQKMTQKQIDDRYHSISGVKYDLIEVQRLLGEGDKDALASFPIGSKDVSSFFVLPTNMSARQEEIERIVSVIEKVAHWQNADLGTGTLGIRPYGSTSASTMSDRFENLETVTRSSDTSSIGGKVSETSPALGPTSPSKLLVQSPQPGIHSASHSATSNSKPPLEASDSRETIETTLTADSQRSGLRPDHQALRRRASHKHLRKRRCELVTITGAAGTGKSSLIQSIQANIRKWGYFASSKFDPARKAPFEPLLRAMSSLFKQIFSESDVNSDYHNMIRQHIRGLWPSVCKMLDLPENLVSTEGQSANRASTTPMSGLNKPFRSDIMESSSVRSGISNGAGVDPSMPVEIPRATTNPRSFKLVTVFVEVMRILSTNKLICLCLDDINYADQESFDLISNVISKKLGIVILTTCRDEQARAKSLDNVLSHRAANITKIRLAPLTEEEVVVYVSATLCRAPEYILPLAMVCLEKSNGNPFYLRQMLDTCHRKGCIWYSWKESVWEYDLDRVFAEFESTTYGQQLNTEFLTKRLQDLPIAARSILAWASLLGSTFSFSFVQKLLSSEFDYLDDGKEISNEDYTPSEETPRPHPIEHAVEGLESLLQAYILVPGGNEDEFSFSHDRYVTASSSLRECHNIEKMNFLISLTMMKYASLDGRSAYDRARHIRQAANLIKRRIKHRRRFRIFLSEAAQKAIESGARPTALDYCETCVDLLQQDPWREGVPDVSYEETLSLYTMTAQLYWLQERLVEAQNLLDSIFAGAHTASDKASAWILQSKLFAHVGNIAGAFTALKTSLLELGLDIADVPTWSDNDEECRNLRKRLQMENFTDIVGKPLSVDANVIAVGKVLIEATSAAFWSNSLLFYQLVLKWIDLHLSSSGTFTQSGVGFAYFSIVCLCRTNDLSFGLQMHDISKQLLKQYADPYALGRGLTLSAVFIAHLSIPLRGNFDILEEAIDNSLIAGDRYVLLFAVGTVALRKLYCGDDMVDIETYISLAPEEFGDWTYEFRGGVLLTATRQVSRALQGKTLIEAPETVMSDDEHSNDQYMEIVASRASNVEWPRDLYNSLRLIPLYLFGHYETAIQVSNEVIASMHQVWSMRITRLALFYASLSLLAYIREHPLDQDRDRKLAKVKEFKSRIVQWQFECDANYLMWSLLIEAEVAELECHFSLAIQSYEAAIDHTQLHDFMLEQALALELQGEFYIRRGARRAARSTLMDAKASYSRIGAIGKADQLTAKHEWILRASTTIKTRDAGIQTVNTIGELENTQFRIEENERQEHRNAGRETAGDRTQAWVSPVTAIENVDRTTGQDISDLGLDVLDLQSILEFNQAISSELQIDKLLAQMTEIILESAGAQAEFAGVIIESENGWSVATSGTFDGVMAKSEPVTEIQDESRKQVILYTIRFKEAVFVHNLVNDDRFLAHGIAKGVISLPIVQGANLLGVLYLEGQPNAFTERNLGVLQLFCHQVGISIANALLFKRIARVSASNTSMIESQKRALGQAREAETKAKVAEAEAVENVRLKEEAAKAKSMFLANVSHELRTPLNGVIGMSELLKATSLNNEQDGYADSIRVCADTLLTVINDILDFSKLEAGKMKLFSVPLNLKETITEVVRALSYTNLERGLNTIEDLNLDPTLLVMGDPVRLHQIFMNLLSNAYKFTAKGSVTVRARTEFEDNDSLCVTCSVTDTGIGITQEQVSRLFKPFSQADSSTQRSYGGSGLGLSICKALIEVLNGKISLESQLGKGTTVSFTLSFPKVEKSTAAGNTEVAAKDPDPMAIWSSDAENVAPHSSTASFFDLSQIPRDQLRICIAEDNPINQKIAVSFVTKLGFKSEAYSDGLQAVEALRKKSTENDPFHLVLMDVQMPVLDGYEATRLIRKDDDPAVRGVLVIAMTASAIRGDREKCLQAGMNNYLAKPVRAAVLKAMLEDYLRETPKPIPDLQTTAHNLAKDVMNGPHKGNGQVGGNAKSQHQTRPTFEKRMSSRNDVPFRLKDFQSMSPLGDDMETPRLSGVRERPPAPSRNGSNVTVTQDDVSSKVVVDATVPPLLLGNGIETVDDSDSETPS